jgi:hypothetical protein
MAKPIDERLVDFLKFVGQVAVGIFARLWAAKIMLVLFGAISWLLVETRRAFLELIPHLVKHVKLTVDLLNIFILAFDEMELVTEAVWMALKETLKLLTAGKFPKHINTNFRVMQRLSFSETRRALTEIALTCTPMDNGPKITSFIIKDTLNRHVCPLVRAAQPTLLGPAAKAATGWLTYNPDPLWGARSCQPPADPGPSWTCTILGVGLVGLDVVLPLVVGTMALLAILHQWRAGRVAGPLLKGGV